MFLNGDSVYIKREDSNEWKGPCTVIGQDGQQVLVKFGGFLHRVHTCRIRIAKPRVAEDVEIQPSTFNQPSADTSVVPNIPTQHIPDSSDSDDDRVAPDPPPHVNLPPPTPSLPSSLVQATFTPPLQSVAVQPPLQPTVQPSLTSPHAALPFRNEQLENFSSNIPAASNLRVNDIVEIRTTDNANPHIVKVMSLSGKRKGKYKNSWNVTTVEGTVKEVDFDRNVTSWKLVDIDSSNHDEYFCDELFLASRQEETKNGQGQRTSIMG